MLRWTLLALVCALAGCAGGDATRPAEDEGPGHGVLIVVLPGEARPRLAQLEADPDAVRFERHYVSRADGRGSPATLLSGRTGPGTEPTLPQLLASLGYSTFAIVGEGRAMADEGSQRGFERYRSEPGASDGELVERMLRWIDDAPGGYLGWLGLAESRESAIELLVEGLKRAGRYEGTLLVITSVHAPSNETDALRETAIHVPLVVKFPRGARPETLGRTVRAITREIDLLPALLAFLDQPVPPDLPGASIFDGVSAGHAFVEAEDGWAFLQDNYKLVVTAERASLYDLAADPHESRDLASELPDRTAGLVRLAVELRSAAGSDSDEADYGLDEETLEHLRSLGYIK